MAAIAILILSAAASFYCYTRLVQLLPMQEVDGVTRTHAVITEVRTPMVKKGGSTGEVMNEVTYRFEADGKPHRGIYKVQGLSRAPQTGAIEPIVYHTINPAIFLRESEYNDLPRQLLALRVLMAFFALAALVLPFFVMHHRAA